MDGEACVIMIDNEIHPATHSDDLNRGKWDIIIRGQGAFGKGCSREISVTSVAALFSLAMTVIRLAAGSDDSTGSSIADQAAASFPSVVLVSSARQRCVVFCMSTSLSP